MNSTSQARRARWRRGEKRIKYQILKNRSAAVAAAGGAMQRVFDQAVQLQALQLWRDAAFGHVRGVGQLAQ